jgi:hypothetical protein
MKTLEWVKAHELETGGIEAWAGSNRAYPEVTGYLLPTLWEYGEVGMCHRLAKWLISHQEKQGGWLGLDDKQHVFDTSAILQGLKHVYNNSHAVYLIEPMVKALKFIDSQRVNGYYRAYRGSDDSSKLYTCRTSGIVEDADSMKYWSTSDWFTGEQQQRPHYIAYALEGMDMAGKRNIVIDWLYKMKRAILDDGFIPFWVNKNFNPASGSCTTATIQFAILYWKYDMEEYASLLRKAAETVLQPDGGLWHDKEDKRCISWAAKYYLDLCKVMQ